MTATTTTTSPETWIRPVTDLAREQYDGLHRMANMILTRPEVSPLFDVMFKGLIAAVDEVGLKTLADATAAAGGEVSAAKLGGLNLKFSDGVEVWGVTDAPPAPAAVETGPVAHDEVPNVAEPPAEPVADDVDLSETATFDTAAELVAEDVTA
jgi:hypothetical protein